MENQIAMQSTSINWRYSEVYKNLSTESESQITFTFIFLIFWSILYILVNTLFKFKTIKQNDSNDVKNRIVSIVHGVTSFWFACCIYLPYPVFNEHNTNFQTFVVLFSLSYCVYDLIACIYYRLSDISLISHHLFCILGFGFGAWSGYGAIDGIGGLFVAEVSNFYMHLRMILRIFNLKNTKSYESSENIYLVSYMLFRGILCPLVVWYPCVTSFNTPIVVKFMCTALTAQSYYFIFQMVGIIRKKQIKYKEMKQKLVQFEWFKQIPSELQKLSFYKKKQTTTIF